MSPSPAARRTAANDPRAPQGPNTRASNLGPVPFRSTRQRNRSSLFSQADTRHPAFMFDQHGRQWSVQIDSRAGMPTGIICNDFQAPWLPDQDYLIPNPENIAELWIDYRRMYLDRKTTLKEYHGNALELCTDKTWPLPTKVGNYSQAVRKVLGNPPRPLEVVAAAAQENPWILGFTDVPDPRLVEFVVVPDELELEIDGEFSFGAEGYDDAVAGGEVEQVDAATRVRPAVLDAVDDEEDEEEARLAAEANAALDAEMAAVAAGTSEAEDLLDEIDDAVDPAKLGGRTVAPNATERAERQAPRRPAQSRPMTKRGTSRGSSSHNARTMAPLRKPPAKKNGKTPRTLADGATPVVSGAGFATEFQRKETE